MSTVTRLRRLLDRGFYPAELPPPFQTRRFSDVRTSFAPKAGYAGATTFFDGATFRGNLRKFGVINPVNYFLLSRFISDQWNDIRGSYSQSKCSGARPTFPAVGADGRAIAVASIATKRSAQRHLASIYPVILSADINRFYGSIYTHSIPWAVLGKEEAKRRFNNNTLNSHWSAHLDRYTRNCNQRQTVGLPIGPDTSRIISEIILSRLDFELCEKGSGLSTNQINHSIDDYQFGLMDSAAAENAEAKFVRALSRYELQLNDFKTNIEYGIEFAPSYFQREFDVLRRQSGRAFVEHFFELLYREIRARPQVNVAGYALKRFAKIIASNEDQSLVCEHLQRLLFAAPYQARWIFPLLLGIWQRGTVSSDNRRLISWGIETSARRNDVGSLLWFLYAAIFIGVRLKSKDCASCILLANELVDVMLLHGRSAGLFVFDVQRLRARYGGSSFVTAAWLPLYEAERKGWDTSPAFSKIGTGSDPGGLYAGLSAANVEFYRVDRQAFTVSSFTGWGLTEADFEPAGRRNPFDGFDFEADLYEGDEAYE